MPAPRKLHILSREDFNRLLAWLDDDRERAGQIYEKIRWRLITIFAARACPVPEELADETIDRVARRVGDIAESYTGEKVRYFFGVGNNVHHEYLKRPPAPTTDELFEVVPDKEQIHNCLEHCLERLPAAERATILSYFAHEKGTKVDLHKRMADELGITINTLRLRILRTKQKLQPCVERCLERTDVS